ncbi:DMT family transporter [Beijerinckia sp. L45]|uniref:DMT family transporter n=1 Tax=Beijerinckia sp. L45 TaxID=1641855 RepID=UPI00131C7F56|nr:DMT family transporter [Beijerinckia sp. L45]
MTSGHQVAIGDRPHDPVAAGVGAPERRAPLGASLGLLGVCVLWGLNWPAVKLALQDVQPWTLRTVGLGVGALALLAVARLRGTSLFVPSGRPRLHIVVAGILNVAAYNIFTSYAQIGTTTGRAAFCAYTMPVWVSLMAAPILKERLDRPRIVALLAAVAGLAVVLWPLVSNGIPIGILCALGAALSWAAGTVYLKWVTVEATPIAIAAWQLAVGSLAVAIGGAIIGGHGGTLHLVSGLAVAYNAFLGTALAYFLWFAAVRHLPAGTAGLGTLMVPVIGAISSAILLADRPTETDLIGFALIVFAAVCALAFSSRGAVGAPSTPEATLLDP